MHSLRRGSLLLPRRLLPQAASLHPLPSLVEELRLLHSKTDAVHPLLPHVLLSRRLLPKTVSVFLLAGQLPILSLPAMLQRRAERNSKMRR
mgnify:CR=1 FL=1